jgi:HNH endonuclease
MDILRPQPTPRQIKNFWAKVEITETCWVWTASRYPTGYGHLKFFGKNAYSHRIAYQMLVGPIPEGLTLDHLCRNRICCNPDHLEAVSQRVNALRGQTVAAANAAKTHCPQGHEFLPTNTYVPPKKPHARDCLECRRAAARRYRAKAKVEVTS